MGAAMGWGQDYADHRNDLWATGGTDFWFCVPRSVSAISPSESMVCVTAEHNCMVTVEIPGLDYRQTYPVQAYTAIDVRMDITNFLPLPRDYVAYHDSLLTGVPATSQPGYGPQNRAVHVSSTDTISVSVMIRGLGSTEVLQILPTEMLRDEYVIQSYPETSSRSNPPYTTPAKASPIGESFFDIVATEDSTEVEIILADDDWMGRLAGDTFMVTLMRGQMLHVGGNDQLIAIIDYIPSHGFTPSLVEAITTITDLSGTRVRALGHKRIGVIEGNREAMIPYMNIAGGTANSDMTVEMALPTAYAGKSFLVPNISRSDTDYLRFTALGEAVTLTIVDDSRLSGRVRTVTVGPYQTEWFQMVYGEGPFYITSTAPVMLALFSMGNNFRYSQHTFNNGDPSMLIVKPTEWWSSAPIHHHTPFYRDANDNVYAGEYETHLFCRTEDVPYMRIDNLSVSQSFRTIAGTPFSYAYFDFQHLVNSRGVHRIYCTQPGYFMAFCQQYADAMHAMWTLPHCQPGGCYLTVNGIAADQLKSDSLWCLYDTIDFRGWSERPADSIVWDFGDGTRLQLAYDQGQEVRHVYADTGHYEVTRIIRWRDESDDVYVGGKSCFTRTPDTMTAHLWVRLHIDTTISVRLCEGSYYFRGVEYYYTDTFYQTTYWTPSGCDTVWTIDLVTCPHCTFQSDTIMEEQLPWTYNGVTFSKSQTDYPVYLDIDDECDSIIYYTLVVRSGWNPDMDSVILMVPNIFTPAREDNNRFRVVVNEYVKEMRVWLYDRQGILVKEFDGLTEDWDGTKDGTPLRQGTYVYYIRYRDTKANGWKSLKGTVTLVR